MGIVSAWPCVLKHASHRGLAGWRTRLRSQDTVLIARDLRSKKFGKAFTFSPAHMSVCVAEWFHAIWSGFDYQSRQSWLGLPYFWCRWNEQELISSASRCLLLKIADVNCRSEKSAGQAFLTLSKFISWSIRNLHSNINLRNKPR